MEGPTPVSAMIYAATMVSAGVYMVIRMFPLISAGWVEGLPLNTTMSVIAVIGSFTALFAATIALAQNDIKRVLAYSTISQLGFMIAALGDRCICGSRIPSGHPRLFQSPALPWVRFGHTWYGTWGPAYRRSS